MKWKVNKDEDHDLRKGQGSDASKDPWFALDELSAAWKDSSLFESESGKASDSEEDQKEVRDFFTRDEGLMMLMAMGIAYAVVILLAIFFPTIFYVVIMSVSGLFGLLLLRKHFKNR